MKKLNLFSDLWSSVAGSQRNDVEFDRRLTVGSPSGLTINWTLKLVSVLVLVLTIGVGNAWGATQDFVPGDFSGGTSGTGSAVSKTLNGITVSTDKGYATTQFRVYKGGKLTISSDYTIKAISFTTNSSYVGGLSNQNDLTTTSWSFTTTGQARITEIVVTYLAKVTFNANGGSCATSNLTQATASSSITLPTPTRSGYTCTGWFTAASGGTKRGNAGATYTPNASDTLYAQWESAVSCATDPTVSASSKGSVTCTSATINCNNGSSKGVVKGSCDISEWGFVYGTSSNPTGNKTSKGTDSSTDVANFSHTFTGLTPGQKYYVRAYAIVNGTTYYGSETDFTCKTITVTANNGSYGSVSGSGLSWTGSPNSGYVYASPAYTITAGNNTTVSKDGNTFTITSTSTENVAITINFESKNCTDKGASSITSTSGGNSYTYGPVSDYHNYSTRQILYTKSDLGLSSSTKKGTIKSIYFYYKHTTAMSKKTDVNIYMANTYLTSLSTSSYVPYSEFTQVYSGSLNCTATNSWNEFLLDTPFEYNGAGNLVVMIDDNSGAYDGSAYTFYYHPATGAQIYKNSDSSNEDPSTTIWSTYTADNYRPSTKFCIEEKDMLQYTVNWYINGEIARTQKDYEGTTLTSIPTPASSDCDGSKVFVGWYTSTYSHASAAPAVVSPAKIPNGGANYYAVFATRTAGGGGAAVNTVMYSENFGGYSAGNVPSGSVSTSTGNRVVYNSGSVTYTSVNGGSDTKIYNENLAGGSKLELLVGKSTGSFSIAGIPNGGASVLTISYKQNSYSLAASVSGAGYSGSRTASSSGSFDVTVATGAASTFTLTFTPESNNVRLDDIEVKVKTQGDTYTNFATTCCTQLGQPATLTLDKTAYTITATWTATSGGHENGYSVQLYNSSSVAVGDPVAIDCSSDCDLEHEFTGLSANTTYYVGVTPTYSGAGDYCTSGTEKKVSVKTDQVYQVTYNGNNKTSGTVPTDANYYEAGATVTVKTNSGTLARSGHTFNGWNTANDGSGEHYAESGSATFTMPAENVTLYAEWVTKKDYYIDRMHGNWDGEHTVEVNGVVYNCYLREGAGYTRPTLTDNEGGSNTCVTGHSHFLGWVLDSKIGAQGQLLTGYTIYAGGSSGTSSTDGTVYWAVWAEDEE